MWRDLLAAAISFGIAFVARDVAHRLYQHYHHAQPHG